MAVFKAYSKYYDLLYKDKDYAAEAEYIYKLIVRYAPDASKVLELGCGTGAHAKHLARSGLVVHGVDMSEQMLEVAARKRALLSSELGQRLFFSHGDARTIRLDQTFDVVISLFHVMSYQVNNNDIQAVFLTAKEHLKPGGFFIFDCWYGPAVLTDRPEVRVKYLEDKSTRVIRIAEPVMHPNLDVVDVNYTLIIKDKNTQKVEELQETHRMRYLFEPEIRLFCSQTGFKLIKSFAWMRDNEPDFTTWSACYVLQV